jgi:hypothetical protein
LLRRLHPLGRDEAAQHCVKVIGGDEFAQRRIEQTLRAAGRHLADPVVPDPLDGFHVAIDIKLADFRTPSLSAA